MSSESGQESRQVLWNMARKGPIGRCDSPAGVFYCLCNSSKYGKPLLRSLFLQNSIARPQTGRTSACLFRSISKQRKVSRGDSARLLSSPQKLAIRSGSRVEAGSNRRYIDARSQGQVRKVGSHGRGAPSGTFAYNQISPCRPDMDHEPTYGVAATVTVDTAYDE